MPSHYEVQRRMAPARDGVQVPVSILCKKGVALDGSSPLLLYALRLLRHHHASRRSTRTCSAWSIAASSTPSRTFAADRRWAASWYDDGKMLKKKNTFNDFIDVAEYLVEERVHEQRPARANGGSAGGLLMGAITNMRPDLFQAVVADVPFVDVINTMLDASLPLTAQEWRAVGQPAATPSSTTT